MMTSGSAGAAISTTDGFAVFLISSHNKYDSDNNQCHDNQNHYSSYVHDNTSFNKPITLQLKIRILKQHLS